MQDRISVEGAWWEPKSIIEVAMRLRHYDKSDEEKILTRL